MATSGKSFGKLLGKFLRKKPKKEKQKHAVSEEEELNMGSDSVNDDDLPVDQDPLSVIPIFDMSDVFVIDRQSKASLSKVYEHVKYMVKELPKEMCTLLSRLYDDVDSKLNNQLSALSEKCTIVVAGKSNPGMNSFMKTILGSDVIPNPHVLSPGTTCCVHSIPSDVEEYFVIQMENGPSERHSYPKDSDSFQGLLCDIMQGKTSHQIDLYCNLPAFGNVENVTILRIDGEENLLQTQMVEWVGDTLILIYVVDSASFDDAYDCKLMQLCKQFLSETRAGTLKSIDPNRMMFVLNNWDLAEEKERFGNGEENKIWKEIVTKIQTYFPEISDEDQMFKLSTIEPSQCRRSKNVLIDRLKKIHEGLRKSVIACQRRQLQEHYSWLGGLLQHVRKHALVRIQFANDAKRSNKDVKLAFGKLQRYTTELIQIKKDLKKRVHSQCTEMAMKLTQHLNQSSVKSDIKTRFYANEKLRRPKYDIDNTKARVKSHIVELIMKEIQKWEQSSKRYQFIATMINEDFEKKFQSLRREFGDVERLVKIENEPDANAKETDTTMPTDSSLTTGEKAILAVTAPLWIPLGIVAAFVAIPVYVGLDAHDDRKLKDFKTDCSPFLDAWLKQYLKEHLKKKSIEKCVFENYESILVRGIDQMSSRIVSASMQADMVYLESILNDKRDSSEIVGEFTDIKTIVQGHIVSLKLFGLQYLAKDVANCDDITRVKEIGTGKHSEVYAAKYLEKDVALKVIKLSPATMFSRLADLELFSFYRSLHHDNIVSLLGVCYTDMLPGAVGSGMREQLSSFRLLILFDKCDTNLEEYVFNNPNFQCGNISQTSRTEASDFFCRTAQAICSAMFYIHWKGIVHTKIQLKNVLLQNGKVKLCGPTCAPDTNIDNGTKFSAPEDLAHKNIGKHTDIFNLGTLLWELWYGRRAAVDLNKGRSPTSRPHPDCNTKHAMPENLARVVQSCWAQNPEERPDASVLLKEI